MTETKTIILLSISFLLSMRSSIHMDLSAPGHRGYSLNEREREKKKEREKDRQREKERENVCLRERGQVYVLQKHYVYYEDACVLARVCNTHCVYVCVCVCV